MFCLPNAKCRTFVSNKNVDRKRERESEQKKKYEINIRNKIYMQRHSKIAFCFARFFSSFSCLLVCIKLFVYIFDFSVSFRFFCRAPLFHRCLLFRAHFHKWFLLTFYWFTVVDCAKRRAQATHSTYTF